MPEQNEESYIDGLDSTISSEIEDLDLPEGIKQMAINIRNLQIANAAKGNPNDSDK